MCCCSSAFLLFGYYPWSAEGYYPPNQGVTVDGKIWVNAIDAPALNHSAIPPGPGNPTWKGPYTLEELVRLLFTTKD